MPGAHLRVKPASACELSASDEASELQTYLQKQLEEDVARIFDESIYSDFEVVCGKLKILTHSCILKARTNAFYNKLETIVHVNIGRNTFDEIYSFISDAYTECNITHQEEEIIKYLNDNLDILKSSNNTCNKKEDTDELEVFLTPKCISPYTEKGFQKSITSSPSTELTKEYYALVPIDSNLFENELIEQDALSNAFQSIINTQTKDLNKVKLAHLNKPTSLCLPSSHTRTVKHSSSCDILINDNSFIEIARTIRKETTYRNINFKQNNGDHIFNTEHNRETLIEKIETAYSPDSLIADDPSNSSEYLSATSIGSPGIGSSQLNVGDNINKMDFTSSDSGLGNAELRESQSSQKEVSLTESTVHDLTIDEANNSFDTISSSVAENDQLQRYKSTHNSDKDVNPQKIKPAKFKDTINLKTSKEEKQRQNEEIVILESSSLSSETGSWESVFPPKLDEKQLCQKFINHERQFSCEANAQDNKKGDLYNVKEKLGPSLVQKSPFKSTSCFIDAASLVDEEDEIIKVQIDTNITQRNVKLGILPTSSQPVPCPLAKLDISPNDWSESNEIEDSLEQTDRDPDSIQRDLSSTIIEMTPITEDSLCSNAFESAIPIEQDKRSTEVLEITACNTEKERLLSSHFFMGNTPHNSIISLKSHNIKQFESEESESEATIVTRDPISLFQNINNTETKKQMKYAESSPIVSGGASIQDHLPQVVSSVGSPLNRRKIENIPIVSGAFIPPVEENNHGKNNKLKSSCASAWIIDMSSNRKSETKESITTDTSKNPLNETFEILTNEPDKQEYCDVYRSNVESDNSERSSQKFYIDFSSLPVSSTPKKDNEHENICEKKNIFSMYIDLGEKSTVKDMPARLTSSLNTRRNCGLDIKTMAKSEKLSKNPVPENNCLLTEKEEISFNSSSVFERYEFLCDDPNLSISEIIGLPKKSTTKDESEPETCSQRNDGDRNLDRITTENHEDSTTNLFVKLSDLDKPIHKTEYEEKDTRMTRSIPDKNWVDHSYLDTSKSIEGIRSFHSENAMSLSRIFPHLKNEFSRSMPLPLSNRTRSPLRLAVSSLGDVDEQRSEISEISSLHSSTCRSGVENSTTDETSQTSSLIGNCQSRLGQDLLRMFLEEIAPDVLVEVAGRRIKAHKCILASRCQYFAAILSGGWVESAGNVIVLPPFSFNVVHFALCHIYSGVLVIPDSISIVELATIADMLGLEGLKEAIMFTLKAKYCHHFHKPCLVCIAGVLECFPLSSVYGLDDLYHKCLKWITKYFTKVWPTKTFATLPKELLDKCYQQHIVNLTTDSVIETVYGCGITVASLQNSRWAETVARMCRRLVNAAAHFVAQRLLIILNQISKMNADAPSPAIQALNDCLAAAIEWAPPDEVCRAYAFLSSIVKDIRILQFPKYDVIINGNQYTKVPSPVNLLYIHANSWQQKCEGALVRAAPRAVGTLAFKELPPDLRKRLRELGCIMYGAQAVPVTASPQQDRRSHSFHSKTIKNQHSTSMSRNSDIDQVRASFVPYAPKPTANHGSVRNLRNNDLRDFKKTIRLTPPQVRTTKAQEERAKFNLSKTSQLKERVSNRTSSVRTHLFENTKPRYLEPRVGRESDKKTTVVRKLVPKIVSSSESSRNSSHESDRQRYSKTDRARSRPSCSCETKTHMSQDSLATTSRPRTAEPSTDSLSESQTSNKYATYTKRRHTSQKESVQSITKPTNIATVTNKCKGRIPVYLNQNARVKNLEAKHVNEPQQQASPTNKKALHSTVEVQQRMKTNDERRGRVSLMKATKSSTAKMVTKIVKESSPNKLNPKISMGTTKQNAKREDNEQQLLTKSALSRSGTFLKDEPTFGDKTTNLDIS